MFICYTCIQISMCRFRMDACIESWPFLSHALATVGCFHAIRLLVAVSMAQTDHANIAEYEFNPKGRSYASYPSLQNASGPVRRLVYWDEEEHTSRVTDIDIENCYMTILLQVCYQFDVLCPILDQYVHEYEFTLHKTMEYYECTRAEAKNMFIVALHGGRPVHHEHWDFFNSFMNEQQVIFEQLSIKCSSIYEESQESSRQSGSNERGAFMSRLCQFHEAKILMAIASFYIRHGIKIEAYMFDGLMLDISEREFHTTWEWSLKACEIHVLDSTQFSIKLHTKDMEPRPNDQEKLQLKENPFISQLGTIKSDAVRLDPIPWRLGGKRVLVINAQLNMGKTFAIMEYIKSVYTRIKIQRILFITCRRQQARSLQNRTAGLKDSSGKAIPVYYYTDASDSTLTEANGIFIVQYESLHTLGQKFRSFGYVIVDEMRAVMAQISSGMTNKKPSLKKCYLRI